MVAADYSISANYDVMSIFNGIRNKLLKKLTVNYISYVDKGLFKISNLLHGGA